jgi:hypothetical protein
MRAGELLDLWEQGTALGPVERALALAGAAGAETGELGGRPYGRTNAGVLALREAMIGPDLAATASCPGCGTRVEFAVGAVGLRAQTAVGDGGAVEVAEYGGTVDVGEYVVEWRPPTPDDLLETAGAAEPAWALRRRCLVVASATGDPVDPTAVPADLLARAEAAMAEADPLAEVLVGLTCPECGTAFESDLDLGSFVWAEVEARARRVLHEVDTLARAYGWTEGDVLSLSDSRRSTYLRLAVAGGP